MEPNGGVAPEKELPFGRDEYRDRRWNASGLFPRTGRGCLPDRYLYLRQPLTFGLFIPDPVNITFPNLTGDFVSVFFDIF